MPAGKGTYGRTRGRPPASIKKKKRKKPIKSKRKRRKK